MNDWMALFLDLAPEWVRRLMFRTQPGLLGQWIAYQLEDLGRMVGRPTRCVTPKEIEAAVTIYAEIARRSGISAAEAVEGLTFMRHLMIESTAPWGEGEA